MYIDLDNFKPVNDVHGHQRGDEVLRELADMLSMGTRVGDLVARLGGDEFALWLEETTETDAAAKAQELLRDSKKLPCLSGYHPHPLYVVCLLGLQARAGAGALRRRSG